MFRWNKRLLGLGFLLIAGTATVANATPPVAPPAYIPLAAAPSLTIDRIDSDGTIKPFLGWKVRGEWEWKLPAPQPGKSSAPTPFLYLEIEPPARVGSTESKEELTLSNLPLPKKNGRWKVRFTPPALSLRHFSRSGTSEGVVVRAVSTGVAVHESCTNEGLDFRMKGVVPAVPGWIGLHCAAGKDDSVAVQMSFTDGIRWKEGFTLGQKAARWAWLPVPIAPAGSTPGTTVLLKRPHSSKQDHTQVPFSILRAESSSAPGKPVELGVFTGSSKKASRFKASVGAATTFLHYSESAFGIDFFGFYGSLKATASFDILSWLSVGGNIFGTVTPTYMSRTDLSWPWFVGANARVGVTFPWQVWSGRFGMSLGYYFWTMIVPDRSYGLSYVAGPQVFVTYGRGGPGVRAFHTYFKYAPLSGGDGIDFGNRDLAIGFGVQVNSPQASIPVLLTLDLDHFDLTSASAQNRVSVATISLGVALQL